MVMPDENRFLDIELLHEKWESTPITHIPLGVKRRLWEELSVDIDQEERIQQEDGWDIEFWSTRKRRRFCKLAEAAAEHEKAIDVLGCACYELPLHLKCVIRLLAMSPGGMSAAL